MSSDPPPVTAGGPTDWAVAQTNLALYRQLHHLGYSVQSLMRIRDAYELAAQLFAGRFRGCGRFFLAHLVGTASIVAELGAAEPVVAAGLLHAAYDQGDFGLTRWRDRRNRVQRAVGHVVEDLIQRYDRLKWNKKTIPHVFEGLETLTEADKAVLLIRLANELDDHMDFARELSARSTYESPADYELVVTMAIRLEQPRLADALRCVLGEQKNVEWLAPLRTNHSGSYQLAWSRGSSVRRMLNYVRFLRYLPF